MDRGGGGDGRGGDDRGSDDKAATAEAMEAEAVVFDGDNMCEIKREVDLPSLHYQNSVISYHLRHIAPSPPPPPSDLASGFSNLNLSSNGMMDEENQLQARLQKASQLGKGSYQYMGKSGGNINGSGSPVNSYMKGPTNGLGGYASQYRSLDSPTSSFHGVGGSGGYVMNPSYWRNPILERFK
ncbi:hypothetical protein QVD17_23578 [Tagetes erecta]|uniref:Uncharacterized protein n=1 Tax=Tagetes erecta TaxID=13708 RepID=A0AAD8KKM6_TARER|nr:hypothetical protein QVD17_23578 [Tagetes erecta]